MYEPLKCNVRLAVIQGGDRQDEKHVEKHDQCGGLDEDGGDACIVLPVRGAEGCGGAVAVDEQAQDDHRRHDDVEREREAGEDKLVQVFLTWAEGYWDLNVYVSCLRRDAVS